MLAAADMQELDYLGPVLCRLGHDRVNLSWARDTLGHGFYHIDGRDSSGRFFSGIGDTPSAALTAAQREVAVRASGGIYVDA